MSVELFLLAARAFISKVKGKSFDDTGQTTFKAPDGLTVTTTYREHAWDIVPGHVDLTKLGNVSSVKPVKATELKVTGGGGGSLTQLGGGTPSLTTPSSLKKR